VGENLGTSVWVVYACLASVVALRGGGLAGAGGSSSSSGPKGCAMAMTVGNANNIALFKYIKLKDPICTMSFVEVFRVQTTTSGVRVGARTHRTFVRSASIDALKHSRSQSRERTVRVPAVLTVRIALCPSQRTRPPARRAGTTRRGQWATRCRRCPRFFGKGTV
jgi:hypothetical protein